MTMMDVITGKTRCDEGQVFFDGGHDLTMLDEATITELGIGRKFQKPTVFESHTMADNLLLALKAPREAFTTLFNGTAGAQKSRLDEIFETDPALAFDREKARGMRLNIPAGTAVRFEPGQTRNVELIPIAGRQEIYGFRQEIMGKL